MVIQASSSGGQGGLDLQRGGHGAQRGEAATWMHGGAATSATAQDKDFEEDLTLIEEFSGEVPPGCVNDEPSATSRGGSSHQGILHSPDSTMEGLLRQQEQRIIDGVIAAIDARMKDGPAAWAVTKSGDGWQSRSRSAQPVTPKSGPSTQGCSDEQSPNRSKPFLAGLEVVRFEEKESPPIAAKPAHDGCTSLGSGSSAEDPLEERETDVSDEDIIGEMDYDGQGRRDTQVGGEEAGRHSSSASSSVNFVSRMLKNRGGTVAFGPLHRLIPHQTQDLGEDMETFKLKRLAEKEQDLMEAATRTNRTRGSVSLNLRLHQDHEYNYVQRTAQQCIHSQRFDFFVTVAITTNAMVLGIQSDWSVKNHSSPAPQSFAVLDTVYAVAFSIELLLRLVAEGRYFVSRANHHLPWNLLDSILVLFALADELFKLLWTAAPDTSVFRTLRILRLIRVVRVIRVARFFRDLRVMVSGILGSLKSLMWALLLLLIISFMFGVCVMEFVSHELRVRERESTTEEVVCDPNSKRNQLLKNWGSITQTVYTLYQAICGGTDWADVADPLVDISPIFGVFFSMYIAVAVFCVLNIVTGVFVENAKVMTAQDETNQIMETLESRRAWFNEVKELWKSLDEGDQGCLDLEGFITSVSDVRTQVYFQRMGIEVEAETIPGLFALLDFDGDGKVDIDEFAMGVQMLHGNAKSIDMARLRHNQNTLKKQISDLTDIFTQQLAKLSHDITQTHIKDRASLHGNRDPGTIHRSRTGGKSGGLSASSSGGPITMITSKEEIVAVRSRDEVKHPLQVSCSNEEVVADERHEEEMPPLQGP